MVKLFRLPYLVYGEVFSLMDPTQFIALSLTSKKANNLCSVHRNCAKLNNEINEFKVSLSSHSSVTLQFGMGPVIFKISDKPEDYNSINKIIVNNLAVLSWNPVINNIPRDELGLDIHPDEHTVQMYHMKDLLSAMEKWISYLEDLFHVPLSELRICFDNFEKGDIDRIMDYYCSDSVEHKLKEFCLDSESRIEDNALPVSILKRQNASLSLSLAFESSDSFNLDFDLLKNSPDHFGVDNSGWIRWEQVLDMKFLGVILLNSKFSSSQIESLVQKWQSGWTPGWKNLTIELCEEFDVFRCVPDGSMDIEFSDYPNVASLLRHESIRAFKFRHIDETTLETDGFHLVRSDKMVATVYKEYTGYCFIQIHPADPEYKFHL